jgi:hypothetical protein
VTHALVAKHVHRNPAARATKPERKISRADSRQAMLTTATKIEVERGQIQLQVPS